MIVHLVIFLVSLILLVKGADYFVEASAGIARSLGISDLIIGLTLTSLGTSVPELAASVSASLDGHPSLIIGNVVGSNIANIGLILGVSAMFKSFKTEKTMYERDGYIMIAGVVLFFVFSLDNRLSFWEALLLLCFYLFYLLFLLKTRDPEAESHRFRDFMSYVFNFEYIMAPKRANSLSATLKPKVDVNEDATAQNKLSTHLLKQIAIVAITGVVIVFSAKYLVQESVWLAQWLELPENVIGLSMIAVGTSIPELSVSISAIRKGKGEMVVGNVLGSNIANIVLILGVSGIIHPMDISEMSITVTIPIMLFFSLTLLYFIRSDWQIGRWQGLFALLAYLIFLTSAVVLGIG